jgi:FixJ family two-component response regulator
VNGSPGRVLVVDDDEAVRVALKRLLRSAGFDVATLDSGAALLDRDPDDEPLCVVLDQRMPGLTGLELQKSLNDDDTVSIVFVTGHGSVPLAVEAMKRDAVDFLTKPVDESRLIDAVSRGLERSGHLARQRRERRLFLDRVAHLTPREHQVGALVIQGLLNKQIAWKLGTAEKTIKVHRARVMEKLAVGSVAELARLAERTQTFGPSSEDTRQPGSGGPTSRHRRTAP